MEHYTKEEAKSAFKLLSTCRDKKWQHSTVLMIADTIADAGDKEKIITEVEQLMAKDLTEQEFVDGMNILYEQYKRQ